MDRGDKMRVALIRPYYRSHLITPPLGLAYLAAALRQSGRYVRVIDGLNWFQDNRRIAAMCDNTDLVGIHCLSAFYHEVVDLARQLKRRGKTVVVGGPHATALPKQTLADTQADFVVVGEGERTLVELVGVLARGGGDVAVDGVLSRASDRWRARELVADLDELPLPDWTDMPPSQYRFAPYGGIVKAYPIASIITSRGCPCRCKFCASPTLWQGRIRYRSPKSIVDEMALQIAKYGVREIHFVDDSITSRRSHIEGICDEILRRDIRIPWALPNGMRVDMASAGLFRLMRRSGCYSVAFGIESGNQEILDQAGKGISVEQIATAVCDAKRAGLVTQGFFIYGLPGETEWTMAKTLEFALKLPLDKGEFQLLDVLPGSALWSKLGNESASLGEYESFQEAAWVAPGLTQKQLQRMQSYSFRRFFLRPKQLFLLLRYLKLRQLRYVVRRVMAFRVFSSC